MMISPPAESLLFAKSEECISLHQSKFKRCSIVIAILDPKGIWRLRFRIVITKRSGVIVFPLHKTLNVSDNRFELPDEVRLNTVAIIGLVPRVSEFYAQFSVYTEKPYTGFIGISYCKGVQDHVYIDEEFSLDIDRKFPRMLYDREPEPLLTFRQQRRGPCTAK